MQIKEEQYLQHYGVLGMKWGRSRATLYNQERRLAGKSKVANRVVDALNRDLLVMDAKLARAITPKFLNEYINKKWAKDINNPKLQAKVWKQTTRTMNRIKPRMDAEFAKKFKDRKPNVEETKAFAAEIKKRYQSIATQRIHNLAGGVSHDGRTQVRVTVSDPNKFPKFEIVEANDKTLGHD